MKLLHILALLGFLLPGLAQKLPLHSTSRWILDSNNQRVKFRCINWAGHMETHLPEGLHKQTIGFLASWIKQQGFNCVRLTYSIDLALNPDLSVSDAFTQAAALANVSQPAMQHLYTQAVARNPFLATATTLDVFGAVVDALWAQGVMTVLDNHVSKATWCCDLGDGNGWWDAAPGADSSDSRYFRTQDWLDGLQAMATWARGHEGVAAMSLRNEIRSVTAQVVDGGSSWYTFVGQGGAAVHAANPDVLVVVGGVSGGTDLTKVRSDMLDTTAWAGKNVWEFHAYSYSPLFPMVLDSCTLLRQEWGLWDGFLLTQGKAYTGPLFLSEFGVGMTGGPNAGLSDADDRFLECLVGYMTGNDADWAVWALQGSYYVRSGTVDYDETWGALNSDWSGWRNPQFPGMLKGMWNVTQGP